MADDIEQGDPIHGDPHLGDIQLGDIQLGDIPLGDIQLGDLLLRPWRQEDVPEILRAFADPAIRHYAATVVDSAAAAARFVDVRSAGWSTGSGVSWAVTRSDTGTVLGQVSVTVVDRALAAAMVGYWLLPRGRGRGVATRAVRAGTAFAFRHLALHRIELAHAVDNVDSCGVAERAGYPYEGTLRDAMRYADGRWSTEHLHARLVDDPVRLRGRSDHQHSRGPQHGIILDQTLDE